jgi:hypothetical protein
LTGILALLLSATLSTLSAILGGLGADFFIIFLKGSQVFTSLGKLTFFHTFTDIPV